MFDFSNIFYLFIILYVIILIGDNMKKIFIALLIAVSCLFISVKADEVNGVIIENNTVSYNGHVAKYSIQDDVIELEYEGCTYEKRRGNSYETIAVNEECTKEDSTFDWETLNAMFDELDDKLLVDDIAPIEKTESGNKFIYYFIPIIALTVLIVVFVFLKESYRR
jgi:hypothetical protein